jgi:hypothetical protein
MAWESGLYRLFVGSPKAREIASTKKRLASIERKRARSALANLDARTFAAELTDTIMDRTGRIPIDAIIEIIYRSIATIADVEILGRIEPQWDEVERDITAAVRLRKEIDAREHWVTNTKDALQEFRSCITEMWVSVLKLLPDSCFRSGDTTDSAYTMPLIECVPNLAEVVSLLAVFPFETALLRRGVLNEVRDIHAYNLLSVSGIPTHENILEHTDKIVLPIQNRKLQGRDLVDAYLRRSPFYELFDVSIPIAIPDEVRFEHRHIIGGTGHGKTQLLQKLILADIEKAKKNRRTIIVIDSQGDLIQKLSRLEVFDPDSTDSIAYKLVIVDPTDIERPFALNLFAPKKRLEEYSPTDRERVVNGIIELYELFFSSFLGAELTQRQGVMFKYLARLMLQIPDATLFTLIEIMEHGSAFNGYMDRLDGAARYFFEHEFFDPSFSATKKQIVKRLWGVLATPAFERMFLQKTASLDMFDAMQRGKIILVNTSKDVLKTEGSALLGRFFIAMVSQAALERAILPERRRVPTYLYVDEAQEYFDDSIETILTQARKYKVGITLAHQSLDQLTPRLRSSIFANTSTKCVGGVSMKDATLLAEEMRTDPQFLTSMKRRHGVTEFALWVKHVTDHAIRMQVPLGLLERQPMLAEDAYLKLIDRNSILYGGRHPSLLQLSLPRLEQQKPASVSVPTERPVEKEVSAAQEEIEIPTPTSRKPQSPATSRAPVFAPITNTSPTPRSIPALSATPGKGGKRHKYLQSLIKELAESHGLRATLEAPLPNGAGQVDVLLERDSVIAAFQVSVTTPAEYELESIKKCLNAGHPMIFLVFAKQKAATDTMRKLVIQSLQDGERERVSVITPEELPDVIASIAPRREPEERIVNGYKVRTAIRTATADEIRQRRESVSQLIAKALRRR